MNTFKIEMANETTLELKLNQLASEGFALWELKCTPIEGVLNYTVVGVKTVLPDGSEKPASVGDHLIANPQFPVNPIAKSLSDLVTAKQLGMIRAISRELGIDADDECQKVMNCRTDELSKRAGSALIQHLQDLQQKDKENQVF